MSQAELPAHADGYDSVQQFYDRLLDRTQDRAQRRGEDFIDAARDAADGFIREQVGDDRIKLSLILDRSYNGPHSTYDQHSFDTDSGMGALKALAASAIVSDVLQHT